MITMYSADWCGDCRRSKRLLNELNVPYTMIDVDTDESAAEKVIEINGGMRSIPVIVFDDVMTSGATLDEIARILKDNGVSRVINWVLLRTSKTSFR